MYMKNSNINHQRIGLVFGSKNEVERVERYHKEPQAKKDNGNPLFAERSLFRDWNQRTCSQQDAVKISVAIYLIAH